LFPLRKGKDTFSLIDSKFVYIKVRRISRKNYKGKLLNFKVDGETYTAEGLIVHNCNYALFLLNRRKRRWKANAERLTNEDLEFIQRESLKPPCSPTPNYYEDDCKGELFKLWSQHQPIFDLREERLNVL